MADMTPRQKITPFLWYDGNAEEAMNYYVTLFKDSKILHVSRWADGGPYPKGTVMTGTFQLCGQTFMVLNGGPEFKFSTANSFFVNCDTQEEVDYLWENLSKGGKKEPCGWLKDKWGLSWQIIPSALGKLMGDKDPAKSRRVMEAMLKMSKIEIRKLQEAFDG
jgi:predicted 3-demethylubiquinone-9 3-methyltransferase (glyoxalase superfamily)